MQTRIVSKNAVIHISTGGGKVEKLSTKRKMWKCGKLPIRQNLNLVTVEN